MSTASTSYLANFDPHAYTSGRWLRRDQLERNARYVKFDFDALTRRIIELCPGATAITNCCKKEGGFNRVFVFTTDNGRRLVAKIPFPIAGPPRLTTLSEVATIHYIRANTNIPVPKPIAWCSDATNPVGCEYIVMEHVDGVQLTEKWPIMADHQRIRCIGNIFHKITELSNMDFPAYGSLYHADAPLQSAESVPLDKEFCIGPHCDAMYWNCHPGDLRYHHKAQANHGPWKSLREYADGLVDTGITRIPPESNLRLRRRYQGTPSEHLSLLSSARAVVEKMTQHPRIKEAAAAVLLHPDLHKRNIFVSKDDPTIVTGIIDWQSTSIQPAFWCSQDVPDFVQDASPSEQEQSAGKLYAQAFDSGLRLLAPNVAIARSMDESFFRPFRYCYRTWNDGAAAFRQELIETAQHWVQLGFPGQCPFAIPDGETLSGHQDSYDRFAAAQALKRDLVSLLDVGSDGWVATKDWEHTSTMHQTTFTDMLAFILSQPSDTEDPIKTEADLREIWPFDL